MTSDDDSPDSATPTNPQFLTWISTLTALVTVVAVVVLALAGQPVAAMAVGAGLSAAGGLSVTVIIRR